MIHLVLGHNGKGKTRFLLERVNEQVKTVRGNVVYLDHSLRHMYELNNQIRYIDISAYPIDTADRLIGFICGILSQNRDIQVMYLDDLLRLADFGQDEICSIVNQLEAVSNQFETELTISLSIDKEQLPEELQEKILIAL